MQIGIIGAGKVGCSLGKYLKDAGVTVTGYFSRTVESAQEAADFTQTKVFANVQDLVKASDTLFITTPDGSIGDVWDCIAKLSIQNKIICHFSGSLSSVVFSGIEKTGASGCSIHPMLAFSDRFSSYRQLNEAYMTIEGQETAVNVVRELFERLGNSVCRIDSDKKELYHCAASIVSNQVIALYTMGTDQLVKCGFDREDAAKLVTPLVRNNVESMLADGVVNALTGPVERNDTGTVEKHLKALEGDDREVYRLLAKRLVKISEEKNPERDYTDMSHILM